MTAKRGPWMRRALLVASFAVGSLVVGAGPASAHHYPNTANANCREHTTTCWPQCGWEFGGLAEATPSACDMPVQAWVTGSGGTVFPVAVQNLPSAYPVVNAPTTSLETDGPDAARFELAGGLALFCAAAGLALKVVRG